MPAVVPLAIGFGAGLAAGLMLSWAPLLAAPLCVAAAALLPLARRAGTPGGRWLALVLGGAAGLVWGGAGWRAAASDCRVRWGDGQSVALVLEQLDRGGPLAPARYAVVTPRECRGAIAVVLRDERVAAAGVVAVAGTWQRELAGGPGWLPRRPERAGRLVVRHARAVAARSGVRAQLRVGAERRLAALFGVRRAGLAAALTVSPDVAIPLAERQRFARSGLAHLLSISGFHVGILAAALVLTLRAARLGPDPARLAATALVGWYVWMLGAPAPALRAAVLLGCWAWCRARQRPPVRAATLATAALVVLVVDPYAVGEAGPWLSFAGAWGCMTASRHWRDAVEAVRDRGAGWRRLLSVGEAAAVSTGAFLATAPVSVLAFGTVAPVAVAANLAAVPLAAFAVPAIALALALSAVPAPGLAAAAALPAAAAGLALDLLDGTTRLASLVPGSTAAIERRVLAAVVLAAASGIVLRPVAGRNRGPAGLGARLAVAGGLVAAAAVWRPVIPDRISSHGERRLALHFLAVGQGDAAVLRTPGGRWVVIDGGPRIPGRDAGRRVVVPFLRRHGARRVAIAIASHGDADHLGGLPAIAGAMPVELVLEPGEPLPRALYREWLRKLDGGGTRWRRARAGDRVVLDGVTIRVWHPDSSWLKDRLPANENSVVVSVEYGGFRAVFPGDAGLPMEQRRATALGAATLLKVGHHGSRTATGTAWLEALRPSLCVISVGANRYGHPDAGTLRRLDAARCATWRTDRAGHVTVETDGRVVALRPEHGPDTTFILSREQP